MTAAIGMPSALRARGNLLYLGKFVDAACYALLDTQLSRDVSNYGSS